MKRGTLILIVLLTLGGSYVFVILSPVQASRLLAEIVFPILALLSGVLIGAVGIFLGSLGNLYNIIGISLQTEKSLKYLTLLKKTVREIKMDVIFIIVSVPIVIVLIYLDRIDIPFIRWFVTVKVLSKTIVLSTLILGIIVLDFIGIIDCVKTMFSLHDHYQESIKRPESNQ